MKTINIKGKEYVPVSERVKEFHRLYTGDMDTAIISNDETHNTKKLPLFVKISPDLNENDLTDIIHVAISEKISGLIVSNTTINKDIIENPLKSQQGGLSGKPLFKKSTKL